MLIVENINLDRHIGIIRLVRNFSIAKLNLAVAMTSVRNGRILGQIDWRIHLSFNRSGGGYIWCGQDLPFFVGLNGGFYCQRIRQLIGNVFDVVHLIGARCRGNALVLLP